MYILDNTKKNHKMADINIKKVWQMKKATHQDNQISSALSRYFSMYNTVLTPR